MKLKKGTLLFLLFIVGFLVRLYYINREILPAGSDAWTYLNIAQNIAEGRGYIDTLSIRGENVRLRTPIYPYLIAGVHKAVGGDYLFDAKLANTIMVLLGLWFFYLFLKLIFGDAIAWFATALALFMPEVFRQSISVTTSVVYFMGCMLALYGIAGVLKRETTKYLIAFSLGGAIMYYARTEGLILVAVGVAVLIFEALTRKKYYWLKMAVLGTVLFIALLLPLAYFNKVMLGKFTLSYPEKVQAILQAKVMLFDSKAKFWTYSDSGVQLVPVTKDNWSLWRLISTYPKKFFYFFLKQNYYQYYVVLPRILPPLFIALAGAGFVLLLFSKVQFWWVAFIPFVLFAIYPFFDLDVYYYVPQEALLAILVIYGFKALSSVVKGRKIFVFVTILLLLSLLAHTFLVPLLGQKMGIRGLANPIEAKIAGEWIKENYPANFVIHSNTPALIYYAGKRGVSFLRREPFSKQEKYLITCGVRLVALDTRYLGYKYSPFEYLVKDPDSAPNFKLVKVIKKAGEKVYIFEYLGGKDGQKK